MRFPRAQLAVKHGVRKPMLSGLQTPGGKGGASAKVSVQTPGGNGGASAKVSVQTNLPWSEENCLLIAHKGEEHRFLGKARVLNTHLVSSVKAAVEILNKGVIPCPDDYCIVFSAQFRTYYLLYRCNRQKEALRLLRSIDDPVFNLKVRAHSSANFQGSASSKPLSVSTPTSRQPRTVFRRPEARSTDTLLYSSLSLQKVVRYSCDSKSSPVSNSTHPGLSASSSQESLASSSTLPPTLPPTPRLRRTLVFPSWQPSVTDLGSPEAVAAPVGHAVDRHHDLQSEAIEQACRNVCEAKGRADSLVLERPGCHEKKRAKQLRDGSISGCLCLGALVKVMQKPAGVFTHSSQCGKGAATQA
eukprot:CAMPEP_0172930154 /NCGR_PEP_ID=MMETSP1075-20121228/218848_1 /TAXON_ID=2916 /ORGANISM="Ceratium fusus, Strain PA161109" /LENGTH=357 /DNA_ID=CAMNT_0013791463 /DNA_START=335 /DNA_END=1408 /DNA_ORIENTATION=-